MHDSQLPCWGLWYYAHVAAGSSWKCRGTHLRLMIQNSMGSPGEPPGIVLSATTSVSMPISPQSLFDFLQNEQLRSEWDELSHGGLMQEMVHIPKGQDCANCISLLRPSAADTNQNTMLVLQKMQTDASGSLIVYTAVEIRAMQVVMSGGDSATAVCHNFRFCCVWQL